MLSRHDHSGFAECGPCEEAADEAFQAALELVEEHGYEVVKVAWHATPTTVYIGAKQDQFLITVTPDKYRVLVVEK